ncbi:MAG: DsbA family protein [Acidimicrobiia bacterium]|nr:DsbA family protein [Acidimicrobiia bacterium]MDH4307265.1 DsbA family protein [Acidimicrobiia bacterium]MDH5293387.1 DsbA family protein [Acidimicrobiia bacterium]
MRFAINFDYLCPFARNANEAVLNGLADGRDWRPTFVGFSLAQTHVEEGEPAVWEAPEQKSGVLALQWGIAAREAFPNEFPAIHRELFASRHDLGLDIRDESVLREAVIRAQGDPDAVAAVVASGEPMSLLEKEHCESVEQWDVFGVPTFVVDDVATFIRFMSRGSASDLARALDLLAWQEMNEFKRTRVPR